MEGANHVRYVERHARKLARSTFYAMGRHRARIEQEGQLLGRIVDMGAELDAIARASTRTPSLTKIPNAGRRPSNWLTCSAARPAAGPTDCS